jgi:hypothetical protein
VETGSAHTAATSAVWRLGTGRRGDSEQHQVQSAVRGSRWETAIGQGGAWQGTLADQALPLGTLRR